MRPKYTISSLEDLAIAVLLLASSALLWHILNRIVTYSELISASLALLAMLHLMLEAQS